MTTRYINGVATRRISNVQNGNRLDLQGDVIADPNSDTTSFEYEYEVVMNTVRESADCIRIDFFSGFSCGFPIDHWVEVDPEQSVE